MSQRRSRIGCRESLRRSDGDPLHPAPRSARFRRCSRRFTIRRLGSTSADLRTLALLDRPAIALVGARACSSYGRSVTRSLARDLAAAGLVVVSGMARGIDGEAHRGALDAGGVTVAVLGCGVDRDYPAAHSELARRICETGLVVSEYEPGVEPAPWRFPARNRIIAGLCRATVVIEARERSGALITADFALEEGREVLAVPGEITSSLSAGTNALLRLGATPVTCAADVLEVFGIEPAKPEAVTLGGVAGVLLERLSAGALTADELLRGSGVDSGRGLSGADRARAGRSRDARGRCLSSCRLLRIACQWRRRRTGSPSRQIRCPSLLWTARSTSPSSGEGSRAARVRSRSPRPA